MMRHGVDRLSFAGGVLTLLVGLVLLTAGADGVALVWVGPIAVIALGILVVVAARPTP